MSLDARLNRLLPAMSARERATMVLKDWKAGRVQKLGHGLGLSDWERQEYNRLIRLMNACNRDLILYLQKLSDEVDKLGIRMGWLITLSIWGEQSDAVALYLNYFTKEPITESAYRTLKRAEPDRWAPVSELANVLTSRRTDWPEEMIEDVTCDVIYAPAWEEEAGRQEKTLAGLVRQGALEGRGRGKDLRIKVASFYAWLGEKVEPRPEYGFAYGVEPDSEARLVASMKANREKIKSTLEWAPPKVFEGVEQDPRPTSLPWRYAEAMSPRLKRKTELLWREMRALHRVLDEAAGEFNGEDPLRPAYRDELDRAQRELEEYVRVLPELLGDLELVEPDEELLATVRGLISDVP